MNPKVSVIIPLYNAAAHIENAIESVLNQTYENIEILIVDDGSTDNSYEVVQKYLAKGIRLFHQINKGACAARNLGIEKSKGEYLQFLDADDTMTPDKIQIQIDRLGEESFSTLATCQWFYLENEQIMPREKDLKIFANYDSPIELLKDLWIRQEFFSPASFLTPRFLIEEAGLWDENILNNQDGEFFCRVILKSKKIAYCDKGSVYYRRGIKNSISNQLYSYRNARSRLETYVKYQDYLSDYLMFPGIKRALATNFYYFIYVFYETHPDLVKIAIDKTKDLCVPPLDSIGGENFKKLSKIFGFYNILRVRKIVDRLRKRTRS